MAGQRDRRYVTVAALLVGAAALTHPLPASAQGLGGLTGVGGSVPVITTPGSVVSDPASEFSLTDIDTIQLPGILQQDTIAATSLTTPGGSGAYTPNAQLIGSLDQQLFAQVNSQNVSTLFHGFQPLPSYTIPALKTVSSATLQTYANALAAAQSQDAELSGETFAGIENTSAGRRPSSSIPRANMCRNSTPKNAATGF